MNVDVSPDGETLIFDLLGDIYSLPFAGGEAVPLTSGRAWDRAPRFSPDGAYVYFISDREGHKNIWRLALANGSLQQVTRSEESNVLGGPNWSQDGARLLVGLGDADTHNAEVILQSVDPASGDMTPIDAPSSPWFDLNAFEQLRPRVIIYSAAQTTDGEVFFDQAQFEEQLGHVTRRIYQFNLDERTRTAITPSDARYSDYKPQLSHDGNLLAYFRQYDDRRTQVRIRDRTTGRDETLIEIANADDASYSLDDESRPNYAFVPDDRQLVFWHDGKIHRVNLADGAGEIVPFRVKVEREVWARARPTVGHYNEGGEAEIIRWPSVSRDGRTMAFSAIGYVWMMNLQTGATRRLTSSDDFEYMPAISPDGKFVAYISFAQTSSNDYGSGRLVVVDAEKGTSREVLSHQNGTYLLPGWSEDGRKIAVLREIESEGGMDGAFGWTLASTGAFNEVAPAPVSSDYLGFQVYARHVGFDKSARTLLFSFPRSRTEAVLAAASLSGGNRRTLAVGTSEIGGITPAPDMKNLALTRRDGSVWVVPFDPGEGPVSVSTLASAARRVSDSGGYYVSWNRADRFTYGFGRNVFQFCCAAGGDRLRVLPIKLPFAKRKAVQPIAFEGARLLTISSDGGDETVIESGTIVVDGARIAEVGPASDVEVPKNAIVVDATGKTIVPGLLDTHYHRIGGSGLSAFVSPNTNFNDDSAIAYGITTAWEPGGPANDGVPATVDLQAAGRISGPRWSHAADGSVGYPWESLTSYAAAVAAVDQHREFGVAVLKEYNTPTRRQRQWLSTAAFEEGLGIVSHLQDFEGMMTRIVDGYTGGDHPYVPVPFFKDVRELLRETGYIWTPNIVITSGSVGPGKDKRRYYCRAVVAWRNRIDRNAEMPSTICDSGEAAPTVPYDTHRVSRVAKQVALAANNGVHISVSAHGMPGSNLHQEMWFLWKGGLPIEDVLRAATIGNAEKLGLQEEVGSLERGKIADFLVLDENPLDDILNTLSLKYTVQGGVVYDSVTTQRADLMGTGETDTAVGQ